MRKKKTLFWVFALALLFGTIFMLPDIACALPPIQPLNHRVVDAEFSRPLNRLVTASAMPKNQLHIYNPWTKEDVAVDLTLAPSCVSVSPDGKFAAVGHDAYVSHVRLTAPASSLKTIPVDCVVSDIVLAGNGYAYAFPAADPWVYIRCINLSTAAVTLNTGGYVRERTQANLHPGGKAIYGADNGGSPSDIEKYDIESGMASLLYDSPYHGDFDLCGDLWISQDGSSIFTKCGNVFHSSEVKASRPSIPQKL
jgi:chitinase